MQKLEDKTHAGADLLICPRANNKETDATPLPHD
jgi:hypothetical protein